MSVFPGMAGSQVLEWSDLDSEIKTAGLKDVSGGDCFTDGLVDCSYRILLPLPTCESCTRHRKGSANRDHRLVSGNMRHNWRTGELIHRSAASNFESELAS
jgi:hypothetical protein